MSVAFQNVLFGTPQAFSSLEKQKEDVYREETTFLQQARRSGVSRVCGEKVAAARTEKLGTHSHTHTLTHTQDYGKPNVSELSSLCV